MTTLGKVIQVAGPAVDVEFPEGQIPVIRTAIRITSEGFNVPDPIDIICEVAQHIGESRVRTIALQPTDGLVRGMQAESLGEPVTVPVGKETLGRVLNVIGEPVDKMGPVNTAKRYPIHRQAPAFEEQATELADVRDRHQGHRPAGTLPARRQDRLVRRRGRGQDGHHSGADQQPGHQARRRFGIRRRGRAHARRQRSVAGIPGSGRHRSARLHEVQVRPDLRPDDRAARRPLARGA